MLHTHTHCKLCNLKVRASCATLTLTVNSVISKCVPHAPHSHSHCTLHAAHFTLHTSLSTCCTLHSPHVAHFTITAHSHCTIASHSHCTLQAAHFTIAAPACLAEWVQSEMIACQKRRHRQQADTDMFLLGADIHVLRCKHTRS